MLEWETANLGQDANAPTRRHSNQSDFDPEKALGSANLHSTVNSANGSRNTRVSFNPQGYDNGAGATGEGRSGGEYGNQRQSSLTHHPNSHLNIPASRTVYTGAFNQSTNTNQAISLTPHNTTRFSCPPSLTPSLSTQNGTFNPPTPTFPQPPTFNKPLPDPTKSPESKEKKERSGFNDSEQTLS
jgi:hypothetical protein